MEALKNEVAKIESAKVDELLVFMLNERFIADIDYRIIISSTTNLGDKRVAVVNLIQDKCLTESIRVWEMLRRLIWIYDAMEGQRATDVSNVAGKSIHIMRDGLKDSDRYLLYPEGREIYDMVSKHETEKLIEVVKTAYEKLTDIVQNGQKLSSKDEGAITSVGWTDNTFSLNELTIVFENIFRFMPRKDSNNIRAVCKNWCTAVEPLFRKDTTICFKILRPATFLEMYKYSLPRLPFRNFTFEGENDFDTPDPFTFTKSEIKNFFKSYGTNIKKLSLQNMTMENYGLFSYDISPWIGYLPNLTHLTIDCNPCSTFVPNVPLHLLVSLKSLSLSDCTVWSTSSNRISPLKIILRNIAEYKYAPSFQRINDVIDFSKATDICISDNSAGQGSDPSFDMGVDVFNAHRLSFENTAVLNWAKAKGKVTILKMLMSRSGKCHFRYNNEFEIKALDFNKRIGELHSRLGKICQFPNMIEKLRINSNLRFICNEVVHHPNLKSLIVDGSCTNEYDVISHFTNCEKLFNLELCDSSPFTNIPKYVAMSKIPIHVKKLKLQPAISFTGIASSRREIDILILDGYSLNDALRVLHFRFIPKVVVIRFFKDWVYLEDVVTFVLQSIAPPKIILGPLNLDSCLFSFNVSLAKYVDAQSPYYQFENQRGTSLSSQQFNKWLSFDDDDISF